MVAKVLARGDVPGDLNVREREPAVAVVVPSPVSRLNQPPPACILAPLHRSVRHLGWFWSLEDN